MVQVEWVWGFEGNSLWRLLVVSVVGNYVELVVVSVVGKTVELVELGWVAGSVKDNSV